MSSREPSSWSIAQSEGKYVVKRRFVNSRQQLFKPRMSLQRAVRSDDGDFAQVTIGIVHARVADDAVHRGILVCNLSDYRQRPARSTTMDRGQVAMTALLRKAVEHRSHKLHQRRLARLVGAVHDGDPLANILQRESVPSAKSINVCFRNSHQALPCDAQWLPR